MHCAPVQTILCSRRRLHRLLDIHYSVLFTSSFPCWRRCLHLCQTFTYTDIRLQRLYADRACSSHTTVKAAEAQTSQGLQPTSSLPSLDSLGRCMVSREPLATPTPAASLGPPLLCKFMSSFSATGKPPGGAPRDPLSGHVTNQQQPCQASCSDTGSQQAPLLGLKKKLHGPVAVAISGGVDSAVAAMLLKNAG